MRDSQLIYNIAIVGFGSIGKRYLQGIIRSTLNINVFIIDPIIDKVSSQDSFTNDDNKNGVNIFYYNNSLLMPKNLDLVIISTTSDVRYILLKRILKFKVKNIILEKVLFSDIFEYFKTKLLIQFYNTRIWVNHPRRLYPIYQKLKGKINSETNLNIVVEGGDWGMASNSLHFIDLWLFLKGLSRYSISSESSDLVLIPSKRDGFDEFYGQIVFFSGHNSLILISNKLKKDIEISVINGTDFYFINETSNYCSLNFNDNKINMEKVLVFQSDLSLDLIENILLSGSCLLPNIQFSIQTHLPFVRFINNFVKIIAKRKSKIT